jgi:Flp pilus assembly protein TadD
VSASEESAGGVYEWFRRGVQLLADGHPDAAVTVLERVLAAEPTSRSVREALGRAQYDAGQYQEAMASFCQLITVHPSDDYAHFALGMAASRAGLLHLAAEHLSLAVAMRPEAQHYARALRAVRARRGAIAE